MFAHSCIKHVTIEALTAIQGVN